MSEPREWILMTDAPFGYLCTRCGLRTEIGFPTGTADFLGAGRAFLANHAACEPAPAAHEVRKAGGQPLPGMED